MRSEFASICPSINSYDLAIQDFSYYLFRKGWRIASLVIPTVFGEPCETLRNCIRRIVGWKSEWNQQQFYDAGDPQSMQKLVVRLRSSEQINEKTPVMLFHGLYSSPDFWMPWIKKLREAQQEGKIGHVIALQLPNPLEERMRVVYQALNDVVQAYQQTNRKTQVDLIGHSLGGYAAHLAAFAPASIQIYDERKIERRWHGVHPSDRNPQVRKVISIAAPTWLCCAGQKDETSSCEPEKQDYYPWKVYTLKQSEESFTPTQIATIHKIHGMQFFDIVGAKDGISPSVSPLSKKQVVCLNAAHCAVATSKKTCELAIELISKVNNSA